MRWEWFSGSESSSFITRHPHAGPGYLATGEAIEIVLDAYAQTLAGTPGNPRRHRIEHGGAMYPALAARAAELGILVVSQPGFLSCLGDGFAEAFPGQADQRITGIRVLATVVDGTPTYQAAGINFGLSQRRWPPGQVPSLSPFRRVDVLRTASVVRVWCGAVRCGFSHQP